MKAKPRDLALVLIPLVILLCLPSLSAAGEAKPGETPGEGPVAWQEKAVEYARMMSQLKWTPVADGMPIRGGRFFQEGKEYTGVPYSNGGYEGRYIGFDIFLKTFLAAAQNPHSVVYTENRDSQGVQTLVIKRGDTVVEEIRLSGTGIIERSFSTCGDYTAYCVMKDGTPSQACEFSVCGLDCSISVDKVTRSQSWEITFRSENMAVIFVRIERGSPAGPYFVWLTDQDRQNGKVTIPADVARRAKNLGVVVYGENRYGRLYQRRTLAVVG